MQKILIFQHVKHENARRFTDLADDFGFEFDVIDFSGKWGKPDLSSYTRLIIMGGPQSVFYPDKDFPSKNFEVEAIKEFARNKKPVFGICLGSQLIAHAFGAKVYPNIINGKTFKEAGYYDISLTGKGRDDRLFNGFPESFNAFQWHGDVFDLPDNAELLATGDFVKNQGFKIKNSNIYGMLCHFDFTPSMVEEIIKLNNEWLHEGNKADELQIIGGAYRNEKVIKDLSRKLFKNWMELK
jgi:GMP synthase (glutamine-hydrolysing)